MHMRHSMILILGLLVWPSDPLGAQSFDCARARSALERAICADANLGAADEALNAAWQVTLRTFPVKDFLRTSQRFWLREVASCVRNVPSDCFEAFRERTSLLRELQRARVYTSYGTQFSIDATTLVVLNRSGETILWVYGNYMPDMNNPRPAPDGYLNNLETPLRLLGGNRYEAEFFDEEIILSEDRIVIPTYIMLHPRQGGLQGTYQRVR